MLLRRETTGKAHSAGAALTGKRAPCSYIIFIVQGTGQTMLATSSSPQRDQSLCWKGLVFCFACKALAAGRSPWRAAGLSGTQPRHATLSPLEKPGPPCLLLLTTHEKPAPRQAQPHRSSNPGTNVAHRIQKNTFFKCPKYNKNSQKERFVGLFFFLLIKRHPPLSLSILLHSATAHLQVSAGVPHPSHKLPACPCLTQA